MVTWRIISGGQTGVDRAALDFAIANRVPHGGWCPAGRWAEDGAIPRHYALSETPSTNPLQRTEWNVRDSDGTAIFSLSPKLQGGSLATAESAQKFHRPWIHLSEQSAAEAPKLLVEFITRHVIKTLNVAGPRYSEEPLAGDFARRVLEASKRALSATEPGR